MFSARIDKQDDDDQMLDENKLFNFVKINRNLAESDIDNFDVRSQLEQQI